MSTAVIACRAAPTGRWEVVTRAPHSALAAWVRRYQGYREWSSRPFRRREAPSATVTLIVSFGAPIRVLDGATRGTHVSFVAGLDERAALTEYTGHQHGRGEDGGVAHAELTLDGAFVMLGGEGDMGQPAGTGSVYAAVDDPDALFERVSGLGAEVLYGIENKDYGSREFGVRDPEGNIWSFGTYRPSGD
jgi:uncharacterized glyoxalase superfamily protein PhnB